MSSEGVQALHTGNPSADELLSAFREEVVKTTFHRGIPPDPRCLVRQEADNFKPLVVGSNQSRQANKRSIAILSTDKAATQTALEA